MAVSLFLILSRRLQAPVAALLLLAGVQLAMTALQPAPTAPSSGVRGALAAQIAPERS